MTDIFKALAAEREPSKPSLEKATFSAADLYADLGLSPTQENPTTLEPKEKSKFLTNQYTLLSTGAFTIYLQGVQPLVANASDANILEAAFTAATVRRIARGAPTTTQGKLAVEAAIQAKPSYYTNKETHKEVISKLASAGINLEKDKVVNRAFPLVAIDLYLSDLAEFLISKGFDSPEAYLAAQQTKESSKLTANDINSIDWDSL